MGGIEVVACDVVQDEDMLLTPRKEEKKTSSVSPPPSRSCACVQCVGSPLESMSLEDLVGEEDAADGGRQDERRQKNQGTSVHCGPQQKKRSDTTDPSPRAGYVLPPSSPYSSPLSFPSKFHSQLLTQFSSLSLSLSLSLCVCVCVFSIRYLNWDEYFMAVAFLSAQRSKDPNKQVGACIVNKEQIILGIGYNGFPRGCTDQDLPWAKVSESGNPLDTKFPYVCHAEMNAILNSNNTNLRGSVRPALLLLLLLLTSPSSVSIVII